MLSFTREGGREREHHFGVLFVLSEDLARDVDHLRGSPWEALRRVSLERLRALGSLEMRQ